MVSILDGDISPPHHFLPHSIACRNVALVGLRLFFNLYSAIWDQGWASSDTRSGVISDLITGLIALFGVPFAIWRILISSQQANIAAKGLIAERFSKAVSQITAEYSEGKPNIISRISGLNELAQIAQDYGETYQRRVAITMCEFIRFNCTQHVKTLDKKQAGAYALRADVSVAFDILENLQSNGYNERLNLSQTDFRNLSLHERTLHNVDFHGSDFRDANLNDSIFSGSNFHGCDFRYKKTQDLFEVDRELYRVNFKNTQWKHAEIENLHFNQCDFSRAFFHLTCFRSVVHFPSSCFQGAAFRSTYFEIDNRQGNQISAFIRDNDIFSDGSVVWSSGVQCEDRMNWPLHWPKENLSTAEFTDQWRAWQKSIGSDPDNPEGSA